MKRDRVLIVDDDIDLLGLVDYNLTRKGYTTSGALNGNLAMVALDEFQPDLVVLDIMLPGKDGLEICRSIREKEYETEIIMLTARGTPEDRVMGFEAGADDYMTKPFEVKELLARIEKLLERRDRVLSVHDIQKMLFHEVNTRMTVIGGYARAIEKRYASPVYDEKTKYIESIKRESEIAAEFIAEVGSLFGIESGKIMIKSEPVDLKRLIRDVGTTYKNYAEDMGVKVGFIVDGALPEIKADYLALRQVLSNLVSNAIKFTEYGGSVGISVIDSNDGTVISVTDNGCGICEEEIPRIFERSYRGPYSRMEKPGSGLGLYIVKELTEAMGIKIEVRSESGRGSEFILTIKNSI